LITIKAFTRLGFEKLITCCYSQTYIILQVPNLLLLKDLYMNIVIKNFIDALSTIEQKDFITQKVYLEEDIISIHGDKYSAYKNNFVSKLSEHIQY